MKLYKVTNGEGNAIHGGDFQWSLPQRKNGKWKPGKWHTVTDDIDVCDRGLHLTTAPWQSWMRWGARVWVAEGKGESEQQDDKIAFSRARLLRPAPVPRWWSSAVRFVEHEIPAVRWLQPDGDPDPAWKLFTAPTWDTARDTARAAARDAARAATRAAAWDTARAAAWDAARAAAWDTARAAAWDAARTAAWDAARTAAWDAGGAATLFVVVECIYRDLDLPAVHREHVRARWNAWRKGYAVLCDIDGVLYAYAATNDPPAA